MSKNKKVVSITEEKLVALIDNIVNEVVATKKRQWISEQKKSKASLLETRIARIERAIKASK